MCDNCAFSSEVKEVDACGMILGVHYKLVYFFIYLALNFAFQLLMVLCAALQLNLLQIFRFIVLPVKHYMSRLFLTQVFYVILYVY